MPVNRKKIYAPTPLYVNSIQSSPNRLLIESTQNCASCSTAGAICLLRGSHQSATSADASEFTRNFLNKGNPLMQNYHMGSTVKEQLQGIATYVTFRNNCKVVESPHSISLEAATNWMLSQPNGTIFVVYIAGIVGGKKEYHFLNAAHTGKIVYIDFQTNRGPRVTGRGHEYDPFPGHLGPSLSNSPFIGVITQQYATKKNDLYAPVQAGSFAKETARLTILAFKLI